MIIGSGFVGSSVCASGLRCFVQSIYYSQCLTSCPSGWSCSSSNTTTTTTLITKTTTTSSSTVSSTRVSTKIKTTSVVPLAIYAQCGGNYKKILIKIIFFCFKIFFQIDCRLGLVHLQTLQLLQR